MKVAASAVSIRVNDEARTVEGSATLHDLALELGIAHSRGVAIAVNDEVVPRAVWPQHVLAEGDRVLVIRAAQGG
jgi:sulfur carrier protein